MQCHSRENGNPEWAEKERVGESNKKGGKDIKKEKVNYFF